MDDATTITPAAAGVMPLKPSLPDEETVRCPTCGNEYDASDSGYAETIAKHPARIDALLADCEALNDEVSTLLQRQSALSKLTANAYLKIADLLTHDANQRWRIIWLEYQLKVLRKDHL